jgi:CheY-like chemotaxis protein
MNPGWALLLWFVLMGMAEQIPNDCGMWEIFVMGTICIWGICYLTRAKWMGERTVAPVLTNRQIEQQPLSHSYSQLTIIHIDDEVITLDFARDAIQREFLNVVVKSFSNSQIAWDALSKTAPDLLITDDKMGELSGQELVGRLIKRNVKYPIIVTSGWPLTYAWVREYRQRGVNMEFLNAPFSPDQLFTILRRQLGARLL